MRYRKTYEGDKTSYIIDQADVIQVVYPPLNDVPYRKIEVDGTTKQWQLTSLVSQFENGEQEKFWQLQIPYEHNVNIGDVLFRIMQDPDQPHHIVIPLELSEMIGTFGGNMLIMNKFNAVIPSDDIPQEVVGLVQEIAKRRSILGW